jgi:hypothetical protein
MSDVDSLRRIALGLPETFSPAVWGALVWTYVELGRIEDGELKDLVERAWRQVAPKGLVKRMSSS